MPWRPQPPTRGWARTTTNVGAYAILGAGPSGGSANYSAVNVTPRMLSITADAQERAYGAPNPPLTYIIAPGVSTGLVNGDTLAGGLTVQATALSGSGFYPIALGTLAASSNYAFSYHGADLKIDLPPIQALNGFNGHWRSDDPTVSTLPGLLQTLTQSSTCSSADVSSQMRAKGQADLGTSQTGGACAN
jgi:hypothetical protein